MSEQFWGVFLGSSLMGLREGLEAGLVVGILLAYIRKTNRNHLIPKIWMGVGAAILVSLAFGALLTFGTETLTQQAQEAIGGGLSIIAVVFVTWMIFWMAENARQLSGELKDKLDTAAQTSSLAVVLLATLSVGREGLETTMFLWSLTRGAGAGNWAPLAGAFTGIAVAVLLVWLMLRGAMKLNLNKFFTYTGAFLVFIAAGVLAYGIHDLQEAMLLPGIESIAYSPGVFFGRFGDFGSFMMYLLHGMFGLSPQTTWLEAVVWWLYVVIVMYFFLKAQGVLAKKPAKSAVAAKSAEQAKPADRAQAADKA